MFGHVLIFEFILIALSKSEDVANILSCSIVPLNHANSTCVNTNLSSFSFSTKITGTDLGEYHAGRITNLFLTSKYMYYVPNNIFKFFPNVTEIGIHTALPQLIKIEKQHFSGLAKLQKLFIVGQRLRFIGPNVFEGAPAITDLFLPSNQIQSISELAFKGLVNCKHLMLNGNQIEMLQSGTFAPMPNLWSVNLSKNRLTVLTEFTFASNQVVLLDLSYNRIESIPENIIRNFISSKDPKRLLSMRGNICDNRIYTKNSHRVEKNLASCVKGSPFLSDRELVERMREEIQNLKQNDARLTLENHNLINENDRLNSELKQLSSSSSCNEERCRTLFSHIWQQPFNAIQNIIPLVNFWKEKSQSLFTTLATIHGDGTCVDPAQNISRPSNDCSSEEQLDLITSVEEQVNALSKTALSLSGQNIALNQFVREILRTAANLRTTTVAPICEICPECSTQGPFDCPECPTQGPFYCPEIICPIIQCPPIKCPACYGVEKSTEAITTTPADRPCLELMQTIESLEAELIILRAINGTYHKKTFKATCGVEKEIEELDSVVLEQSVEIESTKKVLDDLLQGVILLRKEAESVEITSQRRLADIYDLKEDNAACTSLRQIDLIEKTSNASKSLLSEKDRMLEKVIADLKKSIDVRDDFKYDGFEDVGEDAAVKNQEVREAVATVISDVKIMNQQLKEGDLKIQELVEEISTLLAAVSRRGIISDKIQQVNNIIINTVSTVERLIQEQYDILVKHTQKIADLLTSSLSKLWSIFGRRAATTPVILQPLTALNQTLVEKDHLLRNKYDSIEKYITEIKDSRVDLQIAYEDYLANKKDVIHTSNEDIDDIMDERMQACTNEKLEKTVGDQLTRIGVLREEVDSSSVLMAKIKKAFADLLKQCNHCRSFMSKGAGFFKKLFGKTSGCDFAAYEKKNLQFLN